MENTLEMIDRLITRAKRLRDREQYEEAIRVLEEEAISLINEELSAGGINKVDLGSRLADCYGLQGGCYRRGGLKIQDKPARNELLVKSIEKYREGQQIESSSEYGIVSTYNSLNRIVSQILLDPRYLSNPTAVTGYPGVEHIDAKNELEKIEKEMEEQQHRDDSWFLADRALVTLLLDKNDQSSAETYKAFLNPERTHPHFVYKSMLETLLPLSELDFPLATKIKDVVKQLGLRLAQAQQT